VYLNGIFVCKENRILKKDTVFLQGDKGSKKWRSLISFIWV